MRKGEFIMYITQRLRTLGVAASLALAALVLPGDAFAHCDSMDGPVVVAAQQALETGELEPMLIWVRAEDEAEVRSAFDRVRRVRRQGGEAAALADRYFFETVVRLHREGEGASYTGLKPAGTDYGRAVPAGDAALASGSVEELRHLLHHLVDHRLDELFAEASHRRDFAPTDVAAGRAFVEAYVHFMHFGEELEALTSGHGH